MSTVDVHVGLDDAALKARFVSARRRAEAGEVVCDSHVTVEAGKGCRKC